MPCAGACAPYRRCSRTGAHDQALIRSISDAAVELICEAGIKPLLLTLAPESAPPTMTIGL